MKSNVVVAFVLFSSLFFFPGIHVLAQRRIFGTEADKLIPGAEEILYNESRNTISFIRLSPSFILESENHLPWLNSIVKDQNTSLSLIRKDKDQSGNFHYSYRQSYKNIPVEWSRINVHTLAGKVSSVNMEAYKIPEMNAIPGINEKDAYRKALRYFGTENLRSDVKTDKTELVILPDGKTFFLCYRFDLYAESFLKRSYVYIDANTGEMRKETSRIIHTNSNGTGVTMYSGIKPVTTDSVSATSFRLRETARGNGIQTLNLSGGSNYAGATDFTDTDNYFNYTSNSDNAANDAHFGSEATYDYYYNVYGRNSIDNLGFELLSYVHYSVGYVNAFWDGSRMTYGDGDGIDYTPLTSLDIVAHEITHGLTEHTAGLVYSGESGALNESYSDIIGVAVDYYKNPTTANYLMGDQINMNGTPFRSFIQPKLYGCPDTYGGTNWNAGDIVHYNSSVMNHWFYLLAEGGSGTNDIGNNFSVTAIGKVAAAAIAYRTLTIYLTPNSTFADARTYSIQSAIDLYGSCSAEVVQTTNAWYAVGVGGVFSNAVIAGFTVPSNYYCSVPATVLFSNTSFNSTSYIWNFGDGGTSTSANPSHQYNAAGNYTVTLIANGSAACNTTDTLQIVACISVVSGGAPLPASCSPVTTAYCCGVGISRFQLNTINNTTNDASDGYRDYTCSQSTTVTAGDPVAVTITTGVIEKENARIFIDYNNDGQFNNISEAVFSSNNKMTTHTGIIHTPASAVTGQPLRLRVISERYSNSISNSCNNLTYGQAEDYTINFVANTQAPVADFTADRITVAVGDTVHLSDLTIHAPTSWNWSMPGANITSSAQRNPAITYGAIGTYTIQLTVTNAFGNDTEIKTAYISVVNSFNLCSFSSSTVALSGNIYDSGGPGGDYQDMENCTFLISPPCADTIYFSVASFASESCCDYLRIYDGNSNTSPLLLNLFGTVAPTQVFATSGSMYVEFITDGSITYSGFEASWTTRQFSVLAPIAAFVFSDPNPPLNAPVVFSDISLNSPISWHWDFGDGTTSTSQNPSHAYSTSGTFNVTMIAYTCDSSDTTNRTIIVQGPPQYVPLADTLSINLACGGSGTLQFPFRNNGGGELMTVIQNHSVGTPDVLALTYGADLSTEYPNTILSINQYFTNYNLSTVNTTDPSTLQTALTGKDILLVPEQESAVTSVYTAFAPVFQNFVNAGGKVVFCGCYSGQEQCVFNTGLFSGTYGNSIYGSSISTGNLNDSLLSGVTLPFTAPNGTFVFSINNPDKQSILSYSGYDVVAKRNIGSGSAIYVAFDYYDYNPQAQRIIANAIRTNNNSSLASWLTVTQDTLYVTAPNSSFYDLTINTNGLNAGTYWYDLIISTNDPANPIDTVSINLNIAGQPLVSLNRSCINYPVTQQNYLVKDSILIYNSGCDALVCSSITSTLPEFTPSVSSLTIPPFDSAYVVVSFYSSSINTFNGLLNILNNSNDTSICLSAISTGAPRIIVNPSSFYVTLPSGDSTTRVLNVGNTGAGDLYFNINGSSSLNTLASVLTGLNANYQSITSAIPNRYDFMDGVTGTNISDGGNDMYDGGNYINGNSPFNYINYSDNTIVTSTLLGTNGQYFTRKFNGLFVFAADIDHVDSIQITGNLGADGSGLADGGVIQSTVNGINYKGFVKRVYNATDPSVNHIFIIEDRAGINHRFATNTNDDLHTLYGLNQSVRVYYLLFAGNGAAYYDNTTMLNVMNAFLQSINVFPAWLSVNSLTDTVAVASSVNMDVKFNATGLNGGIYTSQLVINCNDPISPQVIVPCTLEVTGLPAVNISYITTACSGTVDFNSNSINTPTNYSWNFGDGGTSSLENPSHFYNSGGVYNVQLIACNTYGCDTSQSTVTVNGINGPIPGPCAPGTISYCCGMGIASVTLNNISNSSTDGIDGYQDFTCTDTTTLYRGQSYSITVATGLTYSENVVAWIDYNNNGAFDSGEEVFNSYNSFYHTGLITVPTSGVALNTPLRMRIASDYYNNVAPQPCSGVSYGQYEDYTIFIDIPIGLADLNSPDVFNVFPNPFGDFTSVQYTISNEQHISLEVYDVLGEKVSVLVMDQLQSPGSYTYKLSLPASGIYFVQLKTENGSSSKRIVRME